MIKILINLLDEKRKIRFNPLVMEMFDDLGRMEGGSRGFFIKHINWNILWPFVKKYFRTGEPFSVLVQNTFTITQIESSADASNQISDKAFAVLDCRLLPGTDVDKFIKRLKRAAGHKVTVTVIAESPSSDPSYITSYFTQMENAIKEVYPGSEVVPILFPASTDNNYFRQKGIPTYGIVPARLNAELLESVHNNNERICLKDLDKGIEVYKLMLKFITSR